MSDLRPGLERARKLLAEQVGMAPPPTEAQLRFANRYTARLDAELAALPAPEPTAPVDVSTYANATQRMFGTHIAEAVDVLRGLRHSAPEIHYSRREGSKGERLPCWCGEYHSPGDTVPAPDASPSAEAMEVREAFNRVVNSSNRWYAGREEDWRNVSSALDRLESYERGEQPQVREGG